MIACASIFISVVAISISWLVICSNKAFTQRGELIEWVFSADEPETRLARLVWFLSVTFEEHSNALYWFRDPFKLYGDRPA